MEYQKIGNTEIEVSKLCVGCMSFGKAGTMHDWTLDEKDSEKMIKLQKYILIKDDFRKRQSSVRSKER